MQLTPADIHNIVFGKPPIGKRGYDEEEVDALLDEAGQEMIRLLEENASLRRQADTAPADDRGLRDDRGVRDELAAAGAELDRARRACDVAERTAEQTRDQLNEARRSAAPKAPTPGMDVERVLAMAQRTADDHMRDAQEQSSSLLSEARERSDRVMREARTNASAVEDKARRHHDESLADIQTGRRRVVEEIEGLELMAGQYRDALVGHIARQEQLLAGSPDE
ncbi:DivIVA domain-containing protein [Actinoplanes bogorensis]|uniref:Cell wall synthesis protein Wag31 n=1 Tax=Paractinoplanes bogorensis TaxID=1610840 RepID=A0ABS5YS76_9ACTN|nr:DivIVA domain-containing protein [Actinoplanes bogorensis]MBU2666299.1 DivIVA domain-containing protein [Actinoplanes bogorensis]